MKKNDGSKTICRPHLIYYLLDFGCTVIYLKSLHTKVTHKHTHILNLTATIIKHLKLKTIYFIVEYTAS